MSRANRSLRTEHQSHITKFNQDQRKPTTYVQDHRSIPEHVTIKKGHAAPLSLAEEERAWGELREARQSPQMG
jgi:hypothetical protein